MEDGDDSAAVLTQWMPKILPLRTVEPRYVLLALHYLGCSLWEMAASIRPLSTVTQNSFPFFLQNLGGYNS